MLDRKRLQNDAVRLTWDVNARYKKVRTYGPEDQKRMHHKRPSIEAVNSYLNPQYVMVVNKVRSLRQIASYALFSIICLVLNREAAVNIRRVNKAVSPTFFNK